MSPIGEKLGAAFSQALVQQARFVPFLVGAVFCVFVFRLLYLSFLHPLARIPGPRLARLTRLWGVRNGLSGNGTQRLLDLHKKHGDIIRIGPNEISCNSLEVYDFLYSQKTKLRKDDLWYEGLIPKEIMNMFTIVDKDTHASLKRLFSNAFSRTNILKFQPTIQAHVDLVMDHIRRHVDAKSAISLYDVTTSYTLDTISKISFGDRVGALDQPGLDDPLVRVLGALFRDAMPIWKTQYRFMQRFRTTVDMRRRFLDTICHCVEQAEQGHGDESLVKDATHRSKEAGYDLSFFNRVTIMSQVVTAGYGTTAISICGTIYHMLNNPAVYNRAHEELKAAWPDLQTRPSLLEPERLPYFEACLKEGLRMSCPAPLRMPRIVGPEGYQHGDHFIPSGTRISSSNYFFCFDEKMFPDPHAFVPERWLSDKLKDYNMYWMVFSKGIRGCIGIHMALAEQRVFVADFIRRFALDSFVDDLLFYESMVTESATPLKMYLKHNP